MFGRRNYGAISGAMAGPSLLSKAAGPLAAAAMLRYENGPAVLLSVLLATSVASLAFYLRAVATEPQQQSAKAFDKSVP
jgi:hypothetical protein